ncbi:sulfite exporter TauE/SafE family protein [Thermococcus alcaliphilus]|uniref:sulfite exporter TauE/SafE family protein n=1 Tax=Thermococcus alcaliphilus TaxID=139207 RepID=UPI002090DD18|nr:sulfite exporter TauE/SafE family protein [Thermococcus alcaliphilus]MCO6040647.1 sulfite exporter TauE/SafE family protein [Thermococcus alcaliphilus]
MEEVLLLLMVGLGGFIGSLMSGGSLITLFILTLFNIPAKTAVGTLKMIIAALTLVSSLTYLKAGILNLKTALTIVLFSLLGSYIGSVFLLSISEEASNFVVMVFLIIGTYFTLKAPQGEPMLSGKLSQSIVGLAIGIYIGVLGIASTLVVISLLRMFFRVDILRANAMAKVIIFFNNFVAFINYAKNGSVDYSIGMLLMLPVIIGSWLGAKTALKMDPKYLKGVFVGISLLTLVNLLKNLS